MQFNRQNPYNDLPDLPPKAELETTAILKMAIRANKAMAELRISAHLIPNQPVLIQTLGLSEAKMSSEIENIVTTNDALYRAFSDKGCPMDSETKEVLYYVEALQYGYTALKKKNRLLTTPLFEEIMRILKNTTQGVRTMMGTKLTNSAEEVVYTPPEGESIIREKLSRLEKFMYEDSSLDPLIQMALVHYQFEAIHPFHDGNGRTGRIINVLFLIEKGLLDIPILYLSRYIISNKALYYQGLRGVTENRDWESWILYILEGLEQTAMATKNRIIAIHALSEQTAELIRSKLPRLYSKDLIEVLFRYPYCKIAFLEDAGIGKRQTASHYLQQLEKIGVLRSIKMGRDMYYMNDAFLKLLN